MSELEINRLFLKQVCYLSGIVPSRALPLSAAGICIERRAAIQTTAEQIQSHSSKNKNKNLSYLSYRSSTFVTLKRHIKFNRADAFDGQQSKKLFFQHDKQFHNCWELLLLDGPPTQHALCRRVASPKQESLLKTNVQASGTMESPDTLLFCIDD